MPWRDGGIKVGRKKGIVMTSRTRITRITGMVLVAFVLALLTGQVFGAIPSAVVERIEAAMPGEPVVEPKQPRKLLVFDLCEGYKHESIPYWNKALEIMGRKSGAFEVVVRNDYSIFEPTSLAKFDAVCFNNTTELKFEQRYRKSLMDFIESGKGIVGIHAATDSFYDWREMAELMGGQFCGHPWTADGTWAVKIDEPAHVLTKVFGGKGFKINDEIYRTQPPYYSRTRQRVLLSLDLSDKTTATAEDIEPTDKDIGISWVKSYGKGRLFYCSLGHNPHITWNPAVLQYYLSGIQFALGDLRVDTANSVDALLEQISDYKYGKSRAAQAKLDEYLRAAGGFEEELALYEKRFINFLKSDATLEGKEYICRKLSVIGTKASVGVLSKMLVEPETSDMARYALERIGGEQVDEVLRSALGETSGKVRVGIINSLSVRRDEQAVEALGKLVYEPDPTTARAAIVALGNIGNDQAAKVLGKAMDSIDSQVRDIAADAYLRCAENLAAHGQNERAVEIYRQLDSPGQTTPIRIAALRGMVGKLSAGEMAEILKGDDREQIQAVVEELAKAGGNAERIKAVVAQMDNFSVAAQMQLLASLAKFEQRAIVLPVIVRAADSENEAVRMAALRALRSAGDASVVGLLARAAASGGPTAEAARQSLYQLHGPGVEQTIKDSIARAEPAIKVELIRTAAKRNATTAADAVLAATQDRNPQVRLEAYKALRQIGGPDYLPALVDLLPYTASQAERRELERTIVALAKNINDEKEQVRVVLAKLDSAKDTSLRVSLLGILGRIGSDAGLDALVAGLEDSNKQIVDTCVRALSGWSNAKPAEALLQVARKAMDRTTKVLALRGYIKLAGTEAVPREEKLGMYRQAMSLAQRDQERMLVLAGLAKVPMPEALELVLPCLDKKSLQAEAQTAALEIALATRPQHPHQGQAALGRIAASRGIKPVSLSKGREVTIAAGDGLLKRPMRLITQDDTPLIAVSPRRAETAQPGTGGQAVYFFTCEESGTLSVSLRMICPEDDLGCWFVQVDGGEYVEVEGVEPNRWVWFELPEGFPIEKGTHTLLINQWEPGVGLSTIKLSLK